MAGSAGLVKHDMHMTMGGGRPIKLPIQNDWQKCEFQETNQEMKQAVLNPSPLVVRLIRSKKEYHATMNVFLEDRNSVGDLSNTNS